MTREISPHTTCPKKLEIILEKILDRTGATLPLQQRTWSGTLMHSLPPRILHAFCELLRGGRGAA